MLQKILVSAIALAMLNTSFGQDSASTKTSDLSITGSADVYYRYSFGQKKIGDMWSPTSFTNSHNSFELGMASLKFDYTAGKVQMVADLGFGKRAQEFSYNDEGILAAVKQLYLSYSATSWLKLTAGSWATHVGYELVDAYANRNYSMSYMFTNGPFFHTGVKAEVSAGKSGFMIGVVNPTDYKYIPDGYINKKFLIAQYSFSGGDIFKGYLNYAGGQWFDTSKSKQVDLVVTSKISNKFSLAYNGTVSNFNTYKGNKEYEGYKSWWASAVYLNYDPMEKLGFTLRGEYFSDENGLKYAGLQGNGSIFATTLSAQLRAGNLTLIPEIRLDASNKEVFINNEGVASKSSASALVAAVYQF